MIYYKIPGRPISKKNSMQMAYNKATGKSFPVQSAAYKKYEKLAKPFLKPMEAPIDYPVNLRVTYWIKKNKDGSIPKAKVDLTNLLNATCDLLVKYKILADDNAQIVYGFDGTHVIYTSGDEYTEVEITEVYVKMDHLHPLSDGSLMSL